MYEVIVRMPTLSPGLCPSEKLRRFLYAGVVVNVTRLMEYSITVRSSGPRFSHHLELIERKRKTRFAFSCNMSTSAVWTLSLHPSQSSRRIIAPSGPKRMTQTDDILCCGVYVAFVVRSCARVNRLVSVRHDSVVKWHNCQPKAEDWLWGAKQGVLAHPGIGK